MWRIGIISTTIIMISTVCIDAPHDNRYDPENPDRAYLSAFVYELGYYPMEAATVSLTQDNFVVRSDTSDPAGMIEFREIRPGIYDLNAQALHYATVTHSAESLWAGVAIEALRIELSTLDFEDEFMGTSSPYKFETVTGSWYITEDYAQSGMHSTPRVYGGTNNVAGDMAISLCQAEADGFLFEANIKVDTSSGDSWRTGFVMRYHDADNHYMITLAPDRVYCDIILEGQITNIQTTAHESIPGVWQKLRIERPDAWIFIRVSLDDELIFTIYDNSLSFGKVGLLVYNEEEPDITTAYFDDVTLDLTYGISNMVSNLHTSH
ncbi:MAG: carboxypeptidase-like regulatory domain-containing protein [candidate division WOR-3 bacterium]|jgi:hypothetical protein